MGIVFACVAPHGAEIIPEVAGDMFDAFAETRKGMEELARLVNQQHVDTIVLATPHSLRLEATIGIITSEFTAGTLEAHDKKVELRCECDRQLAKEILNKAQKAKLPAVGANYGTSDGPGSCMPMDWGTLIPLWFFTKNNQHKPKVVIVTPSRELPLRALSSFGEAIAQTAQASQKAVAFVASADQAHTHRKDGPYGYHPASTEFDVLVKNAVMTNNLDSLMNVPQTLIEDAKPDSLWQIAMLHGILHRTPMHGRLISYQAPTYYGMLCAAYLLAKK